MALYNLARMTSPTTGTGSPITLGSAVPGFLSFTVAGVGNGVTVSYGIIDGINSETGTGVYSTTGPTLTRTVTKSTNADAPINLSGNAHVSITARAEDIQPLDPTLTALAGVAAVADRLPYFNGTDTATVATFTATGRSLVAAADAAAVRTVAGAQAADATLTALAGVSAIADQLPYFNGADTATVTPFTGFARTILDDADAATVRGTIGAQAAGSYQTLDATLTALASYNTNGLLVQTAAETFVGRTITATATQITVTNGDGVGGNPALSFPADVVIPTVMTIPNVGLHLLDTNATHDLIVKPGSDLTLDRTFTLTTGDANRTLTINADTTLGGGTHSGTNTGDQTLVGLGGASLSAANTFLGNNTFRASPVSVESLSSASMAVQNFTAGAGGSALGVRHSRGASYNTFTALAVNDMLGYYEFQGSDGSGWAAGANISSYCEATPTTGHVKSNLRFATDNGTGYAERMRLWANGTLDLAPTFGDPALETSSLRARRIYLNQNSNIYSQGYFAVNAAGAVGTSLFSTDNWGCVTTSAPGTIFYDGQKSGGTDWSGLIRTEGCQFRGQVAGTEINAGMIGECLSAGAGSYGLTISTWAGLATIALTPGDWDVSAHAYFAFGNGNIPFWMYFGIATAAGAAPDMYNIVSGHTAWTASAATGWVGPVRINTTVARNAVLVILCSWSDNTCTVNNATIRARRIT